MISISISSLEYVYAIKHLSLKCKLIVTTTSDKIQQLQQQQAAHTQQDRAVDDNT
jgi:hypothetical protein